MRLTIIAADGLVIKDGRPLRLELSAFGLPPNLHALQWYGTWGELEVFGHPNVRLDRLDEYQPVIDAFDQEVDRIDNPPPPTLEEAHAVKVAEVNAWQSQQRQFFDWNGHRWDSGDDGRANIMGIVIAGIAPPSGYWTSADNVDVPVSSAEEMQGMYHAMLIRASAIHDRQRAMKLEVGALTAATDVLAYEVGW